MANKKYPAVFASEYEFMTYRYGIHKETGYYKRRVLKARMSVSPKTVFCERFSMRGGLPVLWQHGSWNNDPAVGKVLKMGFAGKKLTGEIEIDGKTLEMFLPGGFDALDRGMNSGLSVGIQFLSEGDLTENDGTFDNPDLFVYGKIQILEVSLTPQPRLPDCGLRRSKNA